MPAIPLAGNRTLTDGSAGSQQTVFVNGDALQFGRGAGGLVIYKHTAGDGWDAQSMASGLFTDAQGWGDSK